MNYIRCIVANTDDLRDEEIIFTDDFESSADYFIRPGLKLCCDEKIEDVLPDLFPRNTTFVKNG